MGLLHHPDVIMSVMASQITSLSIVCSPVCLFRRRSNKTSKLRVTGFCEGNSPVTSEFPAQSASNAENVFIWWCPHGIYLMTVMYQLILLKKKYLKTTHAKIQPYIQRANDKNALLCWMKSSILRIAVEDRFDHIQDTLPYCSLVLKTKMMLHKSVAFQVTSI